ncbi:hypothetical protein GN956_G2314 [Arapaima gigas]
MESICGEPSEVDQSASAETQSCFSTSHVSTKRHKELENVALQSSLNSLRMDVQVATVCNNEEGQETGEDNGLETLFHTEHGTLPNTVRPEPDSGTGETQTGEEERTLTDHLNKRLLSSFLKKLNQRDLSLPGVNHLDCTVDGGDEDSNRTMDEWASPSPSRHILDAN